MSTPFKIFGSILDILEGRVTPQLLCPTLEANFRFALGGSTFSDEHCIGETIIIEGIPYISWVENGEVHTDHKPVAKSPFLIGIEKGTTPGPLHHLTAPMTVEAFYGQLAKFYPMGVALAGNAHMSLLHAVYLKKAPIYHENINTHHDTYWSSVNKIPNTPTFLFGVIIPSQAKKALPHEFLSRAFYQNPGETTTQPFDSHTHVALTDPSANVSMVYHLLTQSLIEKGSFTLFPFC